MCWAVIDDENGKGPRWKRLFFLFFISFVFDFSIDLHSMFHEYLSTSKSHA